MCLKTEPSQILLLLLYLFFIFIFCAHQQIVRESVECSIREERRIIKLKVQFEKRNIVRKVPILERGKSWRSYIIDFRIGFRR